MKSEEPKILPNKGSLILRIVVGAYLLYTAYSLVGGISEKQGKDQIFFGVFTVIFVLLGIVLLIFSIKPLIRGEYIGGAGDTSSQEENTSESEEITEKRNDMEENRETEEKQDTED